MAEEGINRAGHRSGFAILIVFVLLAVFLVISPFTFENPALEPIHVPAWCTDISPIRQPDMAPEYPVGVFTFRCNDCHKIIPPPANDRIREVVQHREIELKHGINTWCLSCHHSKNRDAFVDDRGGEISWSQPQLLCARCHGPVYRDWQHGAHGRSNGYWDRSLGDQSRLKCIHCHDPHEPPFPPMPPAPGPNTLRMDSKVDRIPHGGRNPLQLDHDEPTD